MSESKSELEHFNPVKVGNNLIVVARWPFSYELVDDDEDDCDDDSHQITRRTVDGKH